MSLTSKINRTWNKQEKRIVRLLYRKGLIGMDINELYWASYKRSTDRYKDKRYPTRKWDNYLDEVHYCTCDYWGECDEYGLVDGIIEKLIWDNVPEEINDPMSDDMWYQYNHSTFEHTTRKKFIRYLQSLPTVRCDNKINEVLKIKYN